MSFPITRDLAISSVSCEAVLFPKPIPLLILFCNTRWRIALNADGSFLLLASRRSASGVCSMRRPNAARSMT